MLNLLLVKFTELKHKHKLYCTNLEDQLRKGNGSLTVYELLCKNTNGKGL